VEKIKQLGDGRLWNNKGLFYRCLEDRASGTFPRNEDQSGKCGFVVIGEDVDTYEMQAAIASQH
jgi:hypothetical protein